MKFLLIGLLFLVTACGRSYDEGGSEATGGSAILQPATVDQIQSAVQNSKNYISDYFYSLLADSSLCHLTEGICEVRQKILDLPKGTLATTLAKVRIEFRKSSLCKDESGENSNASIFQTQPDTICISGGNLSKDYYLSYRKDLATLVAGQIAQLLGLSKSDSEVVESNMNSYNNWSIYPSSDDQSIENQFPITIIDN